MTEEELKEYLRKNLKIDAEYDFESGLGQCITIRLLLNGEVISEHTAHLY